MMWHHLTTEKIGPRWTVVIREALNIPNNGGKYHDCEKENWVNLLDYLEMLLYIHVAMEKNTIFYPSQFTMQKFLCWNQF